MAACYAPLAGPTSQADWRWGASGFEHRLEALPIPANSERLALAGAFVHYFFLQHSLRGRRPHMLRFVRRCSGFAVGRPLLATFRSHFSTHAGLSEHGPVLGRLQSETTRDRRLLQQ